MDKENTIPIDPIDNSDKESSLIDNAEIIQNAIGNDLQDEKGQDNSVSEISKVRERTFNKELSDLVARVKSNEPLKKESAASLEDISNDDLLRMFHQLFYKSINIVGLEKVDTSFNPFDLYKELSSDDLIYLIYNDMSSLSLNEYSILIYDPENKCYLSYINHINNLNENNIIIDTSEMIYSSITENKYGIILDHQSIERNIYYKKRFSVKDSLYFISLGNCFKDYFSNADFRNISDLSDSFFPILMIQVKENMGEHRKKSIYREIGSKLIIFFFLLQRKITIEKQTNNPVNLHDFFNFLDYTYQKYNKYKECVCFVIKSKKYINMESLFILKYLQIKLRKKLPGISTTLRIEKDKLIIFTQKSNRKILDDVLDDFNKIYNSLFQIETFSDNDIKSAGNISQNIKEFIIK